MYSLKSPYQFWLKWVVENSKRLSMIRKTGLACTLYILVLKISGKKNYINIILNLGFTFPGI